MAMNFVPLDKDKHQSAKIKLDAGFPHAKNSHIAAASIREYAALSSTMPIILIKDPNDNYRTVAMLGVEQDQNLFLLGERWAGANVPMNISRYPFDVRPDGDKLGIFIDENAKLDAEDGQPLFEGDDSSDFMKNRQQFLTAYANSEMQTKGFIDAMAENDLIEEIQFTVGYTNAAPRNITGMYSISEKRLLALDEAKVIDLHRKGYLGAAYSLMLSLGQLSRLVDLSQSTEHPIQAFQIQRPEEKTEEQNS